MTQNGNWTAGKCLTWTAQYFSKNKMDNPRLEAEILLSRVINQNRVQLYMNLDQPLKPLELARYREMIKRRVDGTPTAYLIGEKEFMSLTFEVNRQVLIPRPDTEVLVETALDILGYQEKNKTDCHQPIQPGAKQVEPEVEKNISKAEENSAKEEIIGSKDQPEDKSLLLIDVGTGSGNIATVLARYLPQARVIGIDQSAAALEIAQRNARRHGVEERVAFYEGDLLSPLEGMQLKGRVDLIAANLPYIPSNELPHLMKEVLQEPITALDGGRDGLMYYRRLIPQALEYLKPGGRLIIEIGLNQGRAARKLFGDGWENVQIKADYGGRDRVVYARCKGD